MTTGKGRPRPLKGIKVTSLALNMPGPAALMRCRQMGARCLKIEPPAPKSAPAGSSGDPMGQHNPAAYAEMHKGVRVLGLDLKSERGQAALHRELATTDVLLTSFRPSALNKLGLGWKSLQRHHPTLCQVAIVGSPGSRAEEPGHDLTYLADNGLITGLELPPTLYADMGGALLASEAVLQAVLARHERDQSLYIEVALSEAARWLALPRHWGLTLPKGAVGGGHAGYRLYPCADGRVAVAALEPHFAATLCRLADVEIQNSRVMQDPATHAAVARFFIERSCAQLARLATQHDLPLHCMAATRANPAR